MAEITIFANYFSIHNYKFKKYKTAMISTDDKRGKLPHGHGTATLTRKSQWAKWATKILNWVAKIQAHEIQGIIQTKKTIGLIFLNVCVKFLKYHMVLSFDPIKN